MAKASPSRFSGAVVVVGTGSIGLRHLEALRPLLAEPPIAVPVRPGRELAPELAGARVLSTFADASTFRPVATIIATDTCRHLSDASAALEAGCLVLVEKPLAPTIEGVRELGEIAARQATSVYVACCLRHNATILRFRELLGSVGRVHEVRIECQSYLPDWRASRDYRESYSARAADGGVLRDLIHEIDYALWLFGRPTRVIASLRNTGALGIEAEESASVMWEAGGAAVSLQLDYLTRPARRILRATGEHGVLTADLVRQKVTRANRAGQVEEWPTPQDRDAMMTSQARAFLAAAVGGGAAPSATLDEGAAAVAVCDAARLSSASGRAEPVPTW